MTNDLPGPNVDASGDASGDVIRDDLHPIEASHLQARRERVFLVLAGLFLGSLTMLNILGVSRFLVLFSIDPTNDYAVSWGQWGDPLSGWSFALAIGVLPYPITFLCTDLISEFYGRKRANWVVMVGLMLNLWVVFILWIGGLMPQQPKMDTQTGLPEVTVVVQSKVEDGEDLPVATVGDVKQNTNAEQDDQKLGAVIPGDYAFYQVRKLAFAAVLASMIAYLAAQFCDVYLFHFFRRLTRGKHLWLRNNGSTLISQLVDTVAVILITHFLAGGLPIEAGLPANELWRILFMFIATGYVFKLIVALLDTIPFYLIVGWLKGYLEFDPLTENVD